MTSINSGIFIEGGSNSGQRVLHPAEILGSTGGVFTAKSQTAELAFELGEALMVYYQRGRSFVKQPALIESCDTSQRLAKIQFAFRGEAVSAEQRESYRVSTIMTELCVDIVDEMGCKLVDISVTGCSAIASGRYRQRQLVRITLYHEGEPISGQAIVRGVKRLDAERTRYGLLCVIERDSDGALKKGLREITMAVQRSQLQRLSRA